MRNLETISLAVTAAEMGALAFGAPHTNGAANTIDSLVEWAPSRGCLPAEEQAQIRTTLAESIAGVVSQLLLKTIDGQGRFAVNDPPEDAWIAEQNIHLRRRHPIRTLSHPGRQVEGDAVDGRRTDGAGRDEADRASLRKAYAKPTNRAREPSLRGWLRRGGSRDLF